MKSIIKKCFFNSASPLVFTGTMLLLSAPAFSAEQQAPKTPFPLLFENIIIDGYLESVRQFEKKIHRHIVRKELEINHIQFLSNIYTIEMPRILRKLNVCMLSGHVDKCNKGKQLRDDIINYFNAYNKILKAAIHEEIEKEKWDMELIQQCNHYIYSNDEKVEALKLFTSYFDKDENLKPSQNQ